MSRLKTTLIATTMMAVFVLSVAPSFAVKGATITLEDATKIAREHTPGEVIKIERERGLYEVKLLTPDGKRVKLYIDSETGKVIRTGDRRISLDEAIRRAKKAVSGEVLKAEYEKERYEVKIRKEDGGLTELYIDATTGEITKREKSTNYYEDDD